MFVNVSQSLFLKTTPQPLQNQILTAHPYAAASVRYVAYVQRLAVAPHGAALWSYYAITDAQDDCAGNQSNSLFYCSCKHQYMDWQSQTAQTVGS